MNPYSKWMQRRADKEWRARQAQVKSDLLLCVRCGFRRLVHFINFETCNQFKKPFMPTEAEIRQGQRDREIWESAAGYARRQAIYEEVAVEPKKATGVKKATSTKKPTPAKKAPAKKATPAKKKPTPKK